MLRRRNSYNWSQSLNYFKHEAFHPTLDAATKWIENERGRGSSWEVREYPSLAIIGKSYGVCIASAGWPDQFEHLEEIALHRKSLQGLAREIQAWFTDQHFLYRIEPGTIAPVSTPFLRHSSICRGSSCALEWKSEVLSELQLHHVYEVQKAIWRAIQAR